MSAENLALLKIGFDLTKAAKDLLRHEKPDHHLNDQICRALRTLFFMPNGILALLKELEQTDGAPGNDLRARLINFNDREWKVGRALEALDFDRLQQDLRLSLATACTLQEIRHGKISLRRSIQEEVNYYGQRGVKPDLDRVRALIVAIEKLNAKILEIEKLVNSRAIEH
jgi:hypothetical protein